MKKAASKKASPKRPKAKQAEKCHWAVMDKGESHVEITYTDITEAEALKELADWADNSGGVWVLYKLVPTHTAEQPKAVVSVTCLATGETSTVSL